MCLCVHVPMPRPLAEMLLRLYNLGVPPNMLKAIKGGEYLKSHAVAAVAR